MTEIDYDSSDETHVKLARKSAKISDRVRLEFIKYIMGMVNGRAYIFNLLTSCHVFADSLYSPDALATAYSCGRHSIGQQILAEIMASCPDDFVKMQREADARDITERVRRGRSDKDSNGDDRGPEPYVHPAFGDDSSSAPDSEYNPRDEDRDEA